MTLQTSPTQDTVPTHFDAMMAALNSEIEICEMLNDVIKDKLDAIVQVRLEDIRSFSDRETELVKELTARTVHRTDMTIAVADDLGIEINKMVDLANHLPYEEKLNMLRRRQVLIELGNNIKRMNNTNKDILAAGQKRHKRFFELVSRAENDTKTYGASGKVAQRPASIFNHQA